MRSQRLILALVVLGAACAAGGCAKNYVVTTPLADPLAEPSRYVVGDITDQLSAELPADKRPTAEDILKFKRYIAEEIRNRGVELIEAGEDDPRYEVTGSLLDFKRGSGAVRFFIGFGAGNAKVLTELKLVDRSTGQTVFAGNFEGVVASWGETGDKMFQAVARAFAWEITRGMKKSQKPMTTQNPDFGL